MAKQWHVVEGITITGDHIFEGGLSIGTVDREVVHRMAAAQEMLEALEALIAGPGPDAWGKAHAAIAKARGM